MIAIAFFMLHDNSKLTLSQLELEKENPRPEGGVYMGVSLIYELNPLLLSLHKPLTEFSVPNVLR